jgi:endonuclease/exonuclease/phosphatase family metal-dependent hydrolase
LHERHVKKKNRIQNVSGRVLALDFTVNGKQMRSIAVYVPHCGYSVEDLEQTYNQLRCVTSEACHSKKAIIIGGDFNTQLNVGRRGILLQQFSDEFGLQITNNSIAEHRDNWTFRSSTGITRRLDYVLAAKYFVVDDSRPSDVLNLGSDHRVVRAEISAKQRYKRPVSKKGFDERVDSKFRCRGHTEDIP